MKKKFSYQVSQIGEMNTSDIFEVGGGVIAFAVQWDYVEEIVRHLNSLSDENEYDPDEVLHPCETLNEKLKEMEISQKEFISLTELPEEVILPVLKGEKPVTVEIAMVFSAITEIPIHFWLNKQVRYNKSVSE